MISISVRGEDSESFSSSSSGDQGVNNSSLMFAAGRQQIHHSNDNSPGHFRNVLLNKSFSFDGVHSSAIRGRKMVASHGDMEFANIQGNLSDSPSSSSDECAPQNLLFVSALSTTTDDCNSLTSSRKSRKSHRDKVMIRRMKFKNLKFLDSPSDLISSSSSSDEDEEEVDGESNHNHMQATEAKIIKREAEKVADEMLLRAICDYACSSDESSSCSASNLCQCDPPSLLHRISISSASSTASARDIRKTIPRTRSAARASTPKRKRKVMASSLLLSGSSEKLDLTRPPSLMDQISGKSVKAGHSSESLNSLSSDIFDNIDLPGSDPTVNEAANKLAEGINELTKNFDADLNQTFPIDQPVIENRSHDNLSMIGNAGTNTTTYSIEPSPAASPVVSPFEGEIQDEFEELLVDESPVQLMQYMRIAMTGSMEDRSLEEVDAKSDFGVDDLPTDNTLTLIASESTPEDNKTLIDDSSGTGNSSSRGTSYKSCGPVTGGEENSYYTDAMEDVFNDSSNSEFKSAQDYERFLINENAKLIAHTFAEMANCTTSSATTDDFMSLVSASSFDVLDINDLSLRVSDEEDSRATYNIARDRREKRDLDLTYKLEHPRIPSSRSTGFMSSNTHSNVSSDTTYSLEPPPQEKTVLKIRETRSSVLRSERARKARSMEVRTSDFRPMSHSPTADLTKNSARPSKRQTFVKAVRRAPVDSNDSRKGTSPAATTAARSSSAASKYLPGSQSQTCASKARTGVQAKLSAFLHRIRS